MRRVRPATRRTSRSASFGAPTKLPFDETTGWGSPTLADDAGLLYLVGYPNDVYPGFAYYTGRVAPGEYGTELGQVVGDPSGTDYLFVDALGTTTVFSKRRPDGGPLLLWQRTSGEGGLSTASAEITSVSAFVPDGGFDLGAPVMSRGREVLYFASSPSDNSRTETFKAKRATSGAKGDVRAPLPTFVFACFSESWFKDGLTGGGARPVALTRGLMAPEGYVVEAAVRALAEERSITDVRRSVVAAYARYQRVEEKKIGYLFSKLDQDSAR